MKIAVVVFSEELLLANSLLTQASALSGDNSCELWVLGGFEGSLNINNLGFRKIIEIQMSQPESLSEPICCAEAVNECYRKNLVDIILFCSDLRGNELAARVCALLGCEAMLGTKELFSDVGGVYVKKPVYSSNLLATFRVQALPLVVSMATSASAKASQTIENPEITQFHANTSMPSYLTDIENECFESNNALASSDLVLVAGRGVGKAENFLKLSSLAEKMDGVLGGTRPTVCDGKMPPERMLGMSANVLSPARCIVFGASGAAPFLAGVEKSKLLIAVNRDPNALIFDNCDVGIIADCNEFADALSKQL